MVFYTTEQLRIRDKSYLSLRIFLAKGYHHNVVQNMNSLFSRVNALSSFSPVYVQLLIPGKRKSNLYVNINKSGYKESEKRNHLSAEALVFQITFKTNSYPKLSLPLKLGIL